MRTLLRSEQHGTVLAGVKATPCGWPSASLDPGCGRRPRAAGGEPRTRYLNFGSLRFEGIAGDPLKFLGLLKV